jgi:hypothetical protein
LQLKGKTESREANQLGFWTKQGREETEVSEIDLEVFPAVSFIFRSGIITSSFLVRSVFTSSFDS